MAEEKKRFPWWPVAWVVVPAIAALVVLGFIETVGRQGTIIGRGERIKIGMSRFEVAQILGVASLNGGTDWPHWLDDPAVVDLEFDNHDHVSHVRIRDDAGWLPTRWRLRRWAERAYTAIHDPRR
jgi:hypothetical protein